MAVKYSSHTKASAQFVPAAAASATTNTYLIEVLQTLCQKASVANPIQPIYNITVSYLDATSVGNGVYNLRFSVTGTITYVPTGKCGCCPRTEMISDIVNIGCTSSDAPTSVTIVQGSTTGSYTDVKQGNLTTNNYDIVTSVTITIA